MPWQRKAHVRYVGNVTGYDKCGGEVLLLELSDEAARQVREQSAGHLERSYLGGLGLNAQTILYDVKEAGDMYRVAHVIDIAVPIAPEGGDFPN